MDGRFCPIVLNTFRFDTDKGTSGRGPLYALPKDFTTTAFYININLFEAAGIDWRDIQKHGWTWDRFRAVTRKIGTRRPARLQRTQNLRQFPLALDRHHPRHGLDLRR